MFAGCLWCGPAQAALSRQAVNQAELKRAIRTTGGVQPAIIKAQVLLDRAFVSPGVIDGVYGGNTKKALRAYQHINGLPGTGNLDQDTWKALTSTSNQPVLTTYEITRDDVDGPFVDRIPESLREMAKMERLAYTSPLELLAEKFHMDQDLLRSLNPNADFSKAGTKVSAAAVRDRTPSGKVATVVVDRKRQAVKAYGKDGKLMAFYPATVGSRQFPSPSGNLEVRAVAERPVFTYSGELEYSDLKRGEKIQVPPGPNNPVGLIWIDLDQEGYGIHGTPDPAKISKGASHGCVRLTNWDATELGSLVEQGVPVRFSG
jgi:lipoprotein-anchoring transpeptidase ErfK/SrfK